MKPGKNRYLFGTHSTLCAVAIMAVIVFVFMGCQDPLNIDTNPTIHELAADFKYDHSVALELTAETVDTEHETIVNAALDAHDALHQSVKDLLTQKKNCWTV